MVVRNSAFLSENQDRGNTPKIVVSVKSTCLNAYHF